MGARTNVLADITALHQDRPGALRKPVKDIAVVLAPYGQKIIGGLTELLHLPAVERDGHDPAETSYVAVDSRFSSELADELLVRSELAPVQGFGVPVGFGD